MAVLKTALLILLALLPATLLSQNLPGKIFGTVLDSSSYQQLEFCNVVSTTTGHGTASGPSGKYVLQLPFGKHQIRFSFVGYTTYETEITLNKENLKRMVLPGKPLLVFARAAFIPFF